MSADRQRLKNAIRAIALTPEERRQLLGEGQNKGGKASSAGVGTSDAEESRLCCDGSTSGSANPGTDERDPDADGAGQGGLDSSDPAKLSSGDGTLSGVTDCATGEPVCFDGAGFIPPDEWDSPTEAPPVESYKEGYFWVYGITSSAGQPTGEQLCESSGRFFSQNETLENRGRCEDFPGSGNYTVVYRIECKDGVEACEDPDPIKETEWPEDGCTNLAIISGKIVGSKFDPENDGSYSAPRDSIDLCSNGDQISLAPAANGGFKTINSTTDNGYLYNSKNERIAHIDGNEYSDPTI